MLELMTVINFQQLSTNHWPVKQGVILEKRLLEERLFLENISRNIWWQSQERRKRCTSLHVNIGIQCGTNWFEIADKKVDDGKE